MEKRRCAAWLLAMMLVLGLLLPACPGLAMLDSPHDEVIIVVPEDPAGFPDDTPTKKGLFLTVNKTKAQVGDTLVFKAVWNGAPRRKSILLWVFKDKERVKVFAESKGNRWEYKVTSPGVYKGMAIGRALPPQEVPIKDIYKDSPLIKVVPKPEPTPAMKTMVGGVPLWIEPISDYTIIEGQPAFRIPVVVRTKDDPHFKNDVSVTSEGPNLDKIFKFVKGSSPDKSYFQYRPHPALISDTGSWVGGKSAEESVKIPGGRADDLFRGNEVERVFTYTVTARCKHPDGKEHEAAHSFKLIYLRDRDRNGFPDAPRPEDSGKGNFRISRIPDYAVGNNYHVKKIPLTATEPANFYVSGLPAGLVFTQTKGEGSIDGKVWIDDWQPGEVSRKFRVRVHATSQADKQRSETVNFMITVYQASHEPFFKLFIEPIPPQTVLNGANIKPITVTVYSEQPSPKVSFWSRALKVDEKQGFGTDLVERIMGLPPIPGMVFFSGMLKLKHLDEQKLYHEDLRVTYYRNRYELSGPLKLVNWSESRKDDYFKIMKGAGGTINASQGDAGTFEEVPLCWVNGTSTSPAKGLFSLMPMADQSIKEWDKIKPFKVGVEQTYFEGKVGPVIKFSELPKGLSHQESKGNKREIVVSGKPEVDWKPDERYRRLPVKVIAYFEDDMAGSLQQQSCYINVSRGIPGTPQIKAWGDWYVDDQAPIRPIQIYAEKGSNTSDLHDWQIEGLPKELYMDGGQFIRGTPKIGDWAENEKTRNFPIKVTAKSKGTLPQQEAQFTMTVQRGEKPEEPPAETGSFGIFGILDQEYVNGKKITPIEIKYVNTYSEEANIEVEGLPPGLVHSEKTKITGAPNIKDWLPTEKNRTFSVRVHLSRGGRAETALTIDFVFNVLRKAAESGAGGGSAPDAGTPGDSGKKTPPPAGKTTPPPAGKTTPPPAGKTTPPPAGKKTPPPAGKTTPPPAGKTTPPPAGKTTPPPGGKTTPPSGGKTQPKKGLTIGIAVYGQDQVYSNQLSSIYQGLRQKGYIPGTNLKVKLLNAKGDAKTAQKNAKDFADDRLPLIIAFGQPMAGIMHKNLPKGTSLIFLDVPDPVAAGLSKSNRLGQGPVTGFSSLVTPDALALAATSLKPNALRLSLLHGPGTDGKAFVRTLEGMYLGAKTAALSDPAKLLEVGMNLLKSSDLLILGFEPNAKKEVQQLGKAALKEKKALIGIRLSQVAQGAAASLAADPDDMGLRCGLMAAGILNGQDASKIPYEDSNNVLCYYSIQAAEALGFRLPGNAEPAAK